MKIFPFRALYPNLDLIASSDTFFASIKYQYPECYMNGFYNKSEEPGLYIYEIEDKEYTYLGILGCLDINEYRQDNILIHENTLAQKEQKFIDLLLDRKAMIKPILLSHTYSEELEQALVYHKRDKEVFLEVEFDIEEARHRFWKISDKGEIQELIALFDEQVQHTYIADGHHRTAVTDRLYKMAVHKKKGLKFDRLYCGFFHLEQLHIREFNRIISILSELTPAMIIARLSAICDIEPITTVRLPQAPTEMVMTVRGESYSLLWKDEILKDYPSEFTLIPDVFNKFICQEICGIHDVRKDSRIKYIQGDLGIKGVERETEFSEDVAFYLYPINKEQFKYCSDQGLVLPPKSTYIEPRMKNGLLVHPFKNG